MDLAGNARDEGDDVLLLVSLVSNGARVLHSSCAVAGALAVHAGASGTGHAQAAGLRALRATQTLARWPSGWAQRHPGWVAVVRGCSVGNLCERSEKVRNTVPPPCADCGLDTKSGLGVATVPSVGGMAGRWGPQQRQEPLNGLNCNLPDVGRGIGAIVLRLLGWAGLLDFMAGPSDMREFIRSLALLLETGPRVWRRLIVCLF